MKRRSGRLALVAAMMVPLLIGRLSAQTPGQSPDPIAVPSLPADEIAPRLFSDKNGDVFRMWLRGGDLRAGGAGIFLAAAGPNDTWNRILEILPTETGISALDPDVAFGPSREMAVAYQWRRHSPRTKQVRLARSLDGGKTWTQSSTPVDGSGTAFTPKLAWGRGGSLVVVWADERRHERSWDVYARRSPDGGATWEAEQLLSRFPQETIADLSARPEMVSDGQDRFWSVWVGLRRGRSSLYLSRSSDGGRTWADPVALSGQSMSVFGHRLVRAGDRLVLVWQDTRTGRDRIYAVASTDGGATWSAPARVDHIPSESQVDSSSPSVVLSPDGDAFAVWHDARNGRDDVFIGHSTDGGKTWGPEDVRLDMDEPGTAVSRFAKLARAEDGRLAVAWEDDRVGNEGVYVRVRSSGATPVWAPELVVAPPGPKKGARTPVLIWGKNGTLYVSWEVWNFELGQLSVTKGVGSRALAPGKK